MELKTVVLESINYAGRVKREEKQTHMSSLEKLNI